MSTTYPPPPTLPLLRRPSPSTSTLFLIFQIFPPLGNVIKTYFPPFKKQGKSGVRTMSDQSEWWIHRPGQRCQSSAWVFRRKNENINVYTVFANSQIKFKIFPLKFDIFFSLLCYYFSEILCTFHVAQMWLDSY